jgi:predicted MFS family arabinose efflux permease
MKNPYANISVAVWLLAAISLISKSGSMVMIFFPLYLTNTLGFDISLAGIILSLFGLGTILGSYIGGVLTDKIGFLIVQITSLLFAGILYLLLEHCQTLGWIMLTLFLIGLISAWLRPATAATIARFTPPTSRPLAYALNYQALNVGSTIGPALGGLLANDSFVWLFRVDGWVNIAAALVMWLFFRKRQDVIVDEEHIHTLTVAWWKNKIFTEFLFLTFLIGLIFLFLINVYPLYLHNQYHFSNFEIGIVLGMNGFVIILSQMHYTVFLKQFNILRVIGLGGLIVGLGYLILPFYSGMGIALLSILLITIGEMTSLPFLNNFVVKIAPREAQGKYLGLMTSAFQFPMLLGPIIGTYIYAHYGVNTLWYFSGLIGILILIGFEHLKNKYSQA